LTERQRAQRQVLVIGLDGATFDIIDPLVAEGKMPTLARLARQGARATLTSTIPPNSAPAWTSFMTGLNPAKHGILDFRAVDLRSYEVYTSTFVTSAAFAGKTIFDMAGKGTRGVVAFRVPLTYPTWPTNGLMVAGYPTPDRTQAYTYPADLADSLNPIAIFSHDEILKAGIAEERRNADFELKVLLDNMGRWLKENRHDFYMAVTGISDGFHHKFWKYHDPSHPLHDPSWPASDKNIIREYYQRLDEAVAALLDLVDDSWLVVVMSDHGGGPRPWRHFNTNAWLATQGWLAIKGRGGNHHLYAGARYALEWARNRLPVRDWVAHHLPDRIRQEAAAVRNFTGLVDWTRTRAYRVPLQFPAEGIQINVRGRQPQGMVASGLEYETLREEIIQALREVRDPETGKPAVQQVWRREDIYVPGDLEAVPDIVFVTAPHLDCGPDLRHVFSDVPLSFLERLNGEHTMEGITFFWGEGVRAGARLDVSILDLPPTLLWALGLPVPPEMDGRVVTEAFTDAYLASHPVQMGAPLSGDQVAGGRADTEGLTREEEEEIRKALAGLGYVEE